jgi:iron complex transport system ATP-binding protein
MIIETKDLCFAYKNQPHILKGINFQLPQASFLSIVGPNGAGKTTLLNLLAGLLKPDHGSITIDSSPLKSYSIGELAKKIAVVRQEFVPVFEFTARQVVAMARTPYAAGFSCVFAFENETDHSAITEALDMTDTLRFAGRSLNHLSGGERQLVFIARALAQQTPILLLDEPTSFLDIKHQVAIYDLLKKMQLEKQKTIVAVTHDINLASQYSDMTLLMAADGSYSFGSTRDILSAERIEIAFGVKLFSTQTGQSPGTPAFFFPLGKYVKS